METQKIGRRGVGLMSDPELIAVAGLLLFALCLRLPLLASLPASFSEGEARLLAAALSLLVGLWPLPEGAAGAGPGLSVSVEALSVGLLGANAAAARLPAAVVGALAVLPFYRLARGHCRPLVALGASTLLAASVWSLSFSRAASGSIWVVLYALLAAGALARAGRAGRPYFAWALAGALAGLALLEPPGGRWLALALAACFAVAVHRAIFARRERLAPTLAAGGLALAAALGVVLAYQIPHPGGPAAALGAALGPAPGQDLQSLPVRLVNALRAFVLVDGSALANPQATPPGRPLFDTVTAALYLGGTALAVRRWREVSLYWCFLLTPVAASVLFDGAAVDPARAAAALPFAYLFVALALERLLALPPARFGALQLAALALLLGAVAVNVADYYRWQLQPGASQDRQPALRIEDVPIWAAAQMASLRGGPVAPTVAEWQRQRGGYVPAITPPPTQPRPRPTAAPAPPRPAELLLRVDQPDLLSVPRGVAVTASGELLVADGALRRVQRFDDQGAFLGSLPGDFAEPFDVAIAPTGEIYVLDPQLGVVFKFDGDGAPAGTIGGQLGTYRPRGLGLDRAGNVYVADTGRDRVLVLSPEGELLRTVDKTNARFQQPTDAAVDEAGNLYVVDPTEQLLLKFGPDGGLLLDWGISSTNTIDSPHLAVTPLGEIVVTDPAQHGLVVFGPDGQPLGTLALASVEGALETPVGVAIDAEGNIYVADKGDGSVKKYRWER